MKSKAIISFMILFVFLCSIFAMKKSTTSLLSDYDDFAKFVRGDEKGNVFVTGSCKKVNSEFDIVTVKYNSNGIQQWTARYSRSEYSVDKALSLSLDKSGNIYVAGNTTSNVEEGSNYAIVKYDPDGNQLWVTEYNGTGNSDDIASDFVVDPQGNSYITGKSKGKGNHFDYATLKIDTNGEILWIDRYDGSSGGTDEATSIALDDYGNLYVTGSVGIRVGRSSDFDYHTIKYDRLGELVWNVKYSHQKYYGDRSTDITVDKFGNSFVTGFSSDRNTKEDYATIKYNPNGTEEWNNRYNSEGKNIDWAQYIEVDNKGNIFVSGWSGLYPSYDYLTIKINARGKLLWNAIYNGTGNSLDWVADMKLDNKGNVYVTGKSKNENNDYDYATVKYTSKGKMEWVARFAGNTNSDDRARSMDIDQHDNIYVTGSRKKPGGDHDYLTIKYNSTGIQQWIAVYESRETLN